MGIVASASKAIQEGIARIRSDQLAQRDAAVARLTLIGRRAVVPLSKALPDLPPSGRMAALEVLDRLGDGAALPAVLACLDDPEAEVSARAAAVVVTLGGAGVTTALAVRVRGQSLPASLAATTALGHLARRGAVEALDALLAAAVDDSLDDECRLAALSAAAPAAGRELARILHLLTESSAPRVAAEASARLAALDPAASGKGRRTPEAPGQGLRRARALVDGATSAARRSDTRHRWLAAVTAEGPDALEPLHAALSSAGTGETAALLVEAAGRLARPASIPVLRDLVARLPNTPEALQVAAATHAALAALDSRVALSDLRQRLGQASGPTAAVLVRAAGLLGDATFCAPLAALSVREKDLEPSCSAAFRAVASRHRITRRSRTVTSLTHDLRATVLGWLTSDRGPG